VENKTMTTDNRQQPDTPFMIERLMRHAMLQEEAQYESEEEFLDAMADQVANGLFERRLKELQNHPRELAQELAFQAYESGNGDQAGELVRQALELDPENCDALTLHAILTCEDAGELVAAMEHAATCGERCLGEEFFAEFMGDFWPMVQARPYMRTVKHLAEFMWQVGRRLDAVDLYENLLDLDPADHMGNGLLLVSYYLAMGEIQRSWDLLEDIEDDGTVAAWSWVLLLLLVDDQDAALDALHQAMEANPYVAPWFVNMGDPEAEPVVAPYLESGSEDEAMVCAQMLGESWNRSPEAQMWLYNILVEMGLVDDEAGGPAGGGSGLAN